MNSEENKNAKIISEEAMELASILQEMRAWTFTCEKKLRRLQQELNDEREARRQKAG